MSILTWRSDTVSNRICQFLSLMSSFKSEDLLMSNPAGLHLPAMHSLNKCTTNNEVVHLMSASSRSLKSQVRGAQTSFWLLSQVQQATDKRDSIGNHYCRFTFHTPKVDCTTYIHGKAVQWSCYKRQLKPIMPGSMPCHKAAEPNNTGFKPACVFILCLICTTMKW